MIIQITPIELAIRHGRKKFRQGEPAPKCPPEVEFVGHLTIRAALWLGYMLERGKEFMDRQALCEMLGGDSEQDYQ